MFEIAEQKNCYSRFRFETTKFVGSSQSNLSSSSKEEEEDRLVECFDETVKQRTTTRVVVFHFIILSVVFNSSTRLEHSFENLPFRFGRKGLAGNHEALLASESFSAKFPFLTSFLRLYNLEKIPVHTQSLKLDKSS